jgi:hypothetical protein
MFWFSRVSPTSFGVMWLPWIPQVVVYFYLVWTNSRTLAFCSFCLVLEVDVCAVGSFIGMDHLFNVVVTALCCLHGFFFVALDVVSFCSLGSLK